MTEILHLKKKQRKVIILIECYSYDQTRGKNLFARKVKFLNKRYQK